MLETNTSQKMLDGNRESLDWIANRTSVEKIEDDLISIPYNTGRSILNLEPLRSKPKRKSGEIHVFDAASLLAYLTEVGAKKSEAAIFVDDDPQNPKVKCVINHDGEHGAGWRDHTASVLFRATPSWKVWTARTGMLMPQVDFAEFLEDHAVDIGDPSGAKLLEIAQNLHISSGSTCRSQFRLDNGQVQFQYDQDLRATSGPVKGNELQVPEEFTIHLAPFQGSETYAVTAKLRWRLDKEGHVKIGFKLLRLDDVVSTAIAKLVEEIKANTEISVFKGLAPEPTEPPRIG